MTSTRVEQQLSADQRAGHTARLSVRTRHRTFVHGNWPALAGTGAAVVGVTVLSSLFASGPLQQGLILGSGLTLAGAMLTALVVLMSGTAPLMMGETAEQWTAQELRVLCGHGWKLVNHFGLGWGDHDHVLVGPGGVVLVETKWGGTPWELSDRDTVFQGALSQTLRNARQLSLWHDVARHGKPHVESVLVVWGPAAKSLSESPVRRHSSGVLVMSGAQLQQWALQRPRDVLTAQQVDVVFAAMVKQAGKRDAVELAARPMPGSVVEIVLLALGCVALAAGGALAAAQAVTLTGSVPAWCVLGLALVAGAEVIARRSRWRIQARAFAVGVVATYLLGAATVLEAFLRA